MSDYTQSTNFTAKDALTTGDPEKAISGSDVDGELQLISTAVATKVDTPGTISTNDLLMWNGSGFDAVSYATQTQMEAATGTVPVTPGAVTQHPGVAKAYCTWTDSGVNGAQTLGNSFGVTGVSRTAAGRFTITWTTAFSSSTYAVIGTVAHTTGNPRILYLLTQNTTTTGIAIDDVVGAGANSTTVSVMALGDR